MKKLISKFGEKGEKMPIYRTPGSPHVGINRPKEEDPRMTREAQKEY